MDSNINWRESLLEFKRKTPRIGKLLISATVSRRAEERKGGGESCPLHYQHRFLPQSSQVCAQQRMGLIGRLRKSKVPVKLTWLETSLERCTHLKLS